MKCDFNCNHLHCGLPSLKPSETDTRTEESTASDYSEEFCKDCAKEYQKLLYSDLHHGNIRNASIKSEEKFIHNKENQQISWPARRTNAVESSKFSEDSGYSSLLSSPHEPFEHDDSLPLAGNLETPNCRFIQNKSHLHCSKRNLLPVRHFEELVCSTLKRNNKRNPKSLGIFLDKMVSRGSLGFKNLIGRKMGVDRLDILSELFNREFRHILTNILRHLSDIDLINMAKVSTTWKKILQDDKRAFQTYNKALRLICHNSAKSSKTSDTREYIPHREVLALVQKASIVQNAKKSSGFKVDHSSRSSYSRHTQFSEIAKTLKNTESLKICHRCSSPAKYDSHLQRAVCIRESCGFDFCTKCLCSYHNAKNCLSEKPVKPASIRGPLPGTKKSKQNLQRL